MSNFMYQDRSMINLKAFYGTLKLGLLMTGVKGGSGIFRRKRIWGKDECLCYASANNGFPLVVLHGLTREGCLDKRLISFSENLSACGFRVYTPLLRGLSELDLDRGDIETIVRCVVRILGKKGKSAGLIGFSAAGTYALLAARDPRINDRLSFVCSAGGYYSLPDMLKFAFDTRYEEKYPMLALDGQHIRMLGLGRNERSLYHSIMDCYCEKESRFSGEEKKFLETLVHSPRQKDVYEAWLLKIRRAPGFDIERCDNLASIKAEVMLLHFKEDRLIPVAHTLATDRALKKAGVKTTLWCSEGPGHLNFTERSRSGLFRVFYRMNLLALGQGGRHETRLSR